MIEITKKIPLLSNLPPSEVEQQIEAGQLYLTAYAKGATLYNQKEPCETLNIVLSGCFVTYLLAENGSAMQMFEFAKGQILGANLLFGDSNVYPFTVYCVASGQVLHVAKSAVSTFLQHNDFAMAFIVMLSQNSQRLNKKMRMGLHTTLRENLIEYLNNLATLQQSNTLRLPISKKQLADYLGVQRPSLFRELKKLKDEGIIAVSGAMIEVNYASPPKHTKERSVLMRK